MANSDAPTTRQDLIRAYNLLVGGISDEAESDDDRAYGGIIRAAKGKLVESMATHIIRLAWQESGGRPDRLSLQDRRRYKVPIQRDYIKLLPSELRKHIKSNKDEYFFDAQVDVHVYLDKRFVMGVECKAYAENAMLKRILVDFRLLKSLHPDLICCLLQLENMLGGGYSQPLASPQYGSPRSHVLMSHFPEVSLEVITLLEGHRQVKEPIHNPEYFKELRPEILDHAIGRFASLLEPFA
ncbi:MAG: restriction endonuclease [Chloroflexi bacterium]|nr:restriction endonuclease [Chloroflexota bacterium]